jgi:site-specific recombinase XerD
MATFKAVIRNKKSIKKNGYKIVIRVQHSRTKKEEFSIDEYVPNINDFDNKAGKVRSLKVLEYQRINKVIAEKIVELQGKESIGKESKGDEVSLIRQKDDLLDEYERKIKSLEFDGAPTTLSNYKVSFGHLNAYLKSKKGKLKLSAEELDDIFLDAYKYYFKAKGFKESTIKTYFKHLRTVYKKVCRRYQLRLHSPFEGYELRDIEEPIILSLDIIQKLKNYVPKTKKGFRIKHMGFFQYYTQGTRVSDALNIRWSNIHINDDIEGKFKNSNRVADIIYYGLNKHLFNSDKVSFDLKFKAIKTGTDHDIRLGDKAIFQLRYFLDRDLQEEYLNSDEITDYGLRTYLRMETSNKTIVQTYEFFVNRLKPLIIEQIRRTPNKCIMHNKDLNGFNRDQLIKWIKGETSNINTIWKENEKEEFYPITDHISTHCFRHLFAMIYYTKQRDVYSLSRLLYHKDIQTTQTYLKRMDIKPINSVDVNSFYDL